MIGAIVGLILALILLGVIWHIVVNMFLPLITIAEPFATIVRALLILLVVLIVFWVIVTVLGMVGIHVPTFRLTHG